MTAAVLRTVIKETLSNSMFYIFWASKHVGAVNNKHCATIWKWKFECQHTLLLSYSPPLSPFSSRFTSSFCYTLRLYVGQFAQSWRTIGCVRPLIQSGATSTLVNKQRSYVPWLPNQQAELRVLAFCKFRTQPSSENTDLRTCTSGRKGSSLATSMPKLSSPICIASSPQRRAVTG